MCCGSQSHKAAGQTSWLWLPAAQAICCPVLPRGANTPHASCFNLKEETKTKRQARTLHLPHCEQKSSWNRSAETIRGCIWLLETGNSHYLNLNYTATAWNLLPLKGVFFFLAHAKKQLKIPASPTLPHLTFPFLKAGIKIQRKVRVGFSHSEIWVTTLCSALGCMWPRGPGTPTACSFGHADSNHRDQMPWVSTHLAS